MEGSIKNRSSIERKVLNPLEKRGNNHHSRFFVQKPRVASGGYSTYGAFKYLVLLWDCKKSNASFVMIDNENITAIERLSWRRNRVLACGISRNNASER
jgi:hypothetical protein